MVTASQFDNDTALPAREHINSFISRTAEKFAKPRLRLLEIGPQERSEVRAHFQNCEIETLDLVPDHSPTIVGDLLKRNEQIPDSSYDIISCLEVLEHTMNPFIAVEELRRIAKDGALILFSAPLNWRIHGPIPDCWRFTEFGWRVLLKDFEILEIDKLDTPDRTLFPIKYNVLARVDKTRAVSYDELKFDPVD